MYIFNKTFKFPYHEENCSLTLETPSIHAKLTSLINLFMISAVPVPVQRAVAIATIININLSCCFRESITDF